MSKPKLYLAVSGPLLIPSQSPDPYLGTGIAEYARPFLAWAHERFDVHLLTDDHPRHVHYLTQKLGFPGDALPPHTFDLNKADVINPHDDFYWVDSELIPGEVAWLAKHGHYDRFLSVDPTVGITHEHKKKLEGLTRTSRRNNP